MNILFGAYGVYLAWIVAVTATAGSLYLSEVLGFVPCTLCWYQRIFMYPLTLLLGIASFRGDAGISIYALPLTITGGLISSFHYAQQKISYLAEKFASTCRAGVPCSSQYIDWFGFITIPFMALTAFILISVLLVYAYRFASTNARNSS